MKRKTDCLIKATVLILAVAVPRCPSAPIADDDANAKLIALIEAYQKSGAMPPGVWPDVSSRGLHNLDTQDRAVRAELHGISRNELRAENRELYDLLEWQIDCRLDQLQVRLYLTPFSDDRRLLPSAGLLGAIDPLWSLPNRPRRVSTKNVFGCLNHFRSTPTKWSRFYERPRQGACCPLATLLGRR